MSTPPSIIGLCGYAGSGKDTVAKIIVETYKSNVVITAFADALRNLAAKLNVHLPPEENGDRVRYLDVLQKYGGYEKAKRAVPGVRKYLVALGYGMRELVDPDIWINMVLPLKTKNNTNTISLPDKDTINKVVNYSMVKTDEDLGVIHSFIQEYYARNTENSTATVVITDVRYPNECERVLAQGGRVYYISRPNVGPANETEAKSIADILAGYSERFVTLENNDTIETLYQKLAIIK
jgi:hypothetical protein